MSGMPQTAGLVARRGHLAPEDAPTVARLRAAGAIPVGTTNTSELCMWLESNNQVYGRTSNPYDARRIVGGSSGGEGAIIGAGGSPFGLGSDVGGSIRMPAFFNGVFGHKPSSGLVPNTGQFPSPSGAREGRRYLVTGPLARSARDLPLLLSILAGPDGACDACEPMTLEDSANVSFRGRRVLDIRNDAAHCHPAADRQSAHRVARRLRPRAGRRARRRQRRPLRDGRSGSRDGVRGVRRPPRPRDHQRRHRPAPDLTVGALPEANVSALTQTLSEARDRRRVRLVHADERAPLDGAAATPTRERQPRFARRTQDRDGSTRPTSTPRWWWTVATVHVSSGSVAVSRELRSRWALEQHPGGRVRVRFEIACRADPDAVLLEPLDLVRRALRGRSAVKDYRSPTAPVIALAVVLLRGTLGNAKVPPPRLVRLRRAHFVRADAA